MPNNTNFTKVIENIINNKVNGFENLTSFKEYNSFEEILRDCIYATHIYINPDDNNFQIATDPLPEDLKSIEQYLHQIINIGKVLPVYVY